MSRMASENVRPDRVSYDRVIGYSSLDKIDAAKARTTVSIAKALVDRILSTKGTDEILVAGCGDGTEAALLCDVFGLRTVGVDLSIRGDETFRDGKLQLRHGDLSKLPYPDNRFPLIYSYHVLEHVPDHYVVLSELERVLRPGGALLIGFPNKNRIIMYLGTHQHVTFLERVFWNLKDYKRRFEGRFENRLGAHAGFTQKEFTSDAQKIFADILPIRRDYMREKYKRHLSLVNLLIKLRLDEYFFPSNYFICKKGAANGG
jgi:ubiquinone/menaquinone biosynthesis C-methylase UbiE